MRPHISTVVQAGQAVLKQIVPPTSYGILQILIAVLLLSCSSPAPPAVGDDEMVGRPAAAVETTESPPPRHGVLWYHIEPATDHVAIQVRLLDPPTKATFFLPGPWAGHRGFDEMITVGQARSAEGSLSLTVDRQQGRIDVETNGADWVEVSYRIETGSGPGDHHRFAPWQTDEAFFAYAPTILVVPSDDVSRHIRDIPVEIHLSEPWTVTATWPLHHIQDRRPRRIAGFVADDIRDLRDAFIGAGQSWEQVDQTLDGATLDLTLTDQFAFEPEELLEAASIISQHYLDAFGLYDRLSGIVMPRTDDKEEAGALRGTGRRGGFVLEVPTDHGIDDELLLLLAHEALHMWNGHQLVAHPDAADDTTWFKEGVTHYIALKSLSRLALIDNRAVRRELAQAAQYYLRNPMIAGGNVRAVDELRFPYDQGLLIALAIDLTLYEVSDGALGIEDWLTTLVSPPFAGSSDGYDSSVLRTGLEYLIADYDQAPLRRYHALVERQRTIDVTDLFGRLGLHFLRPDGDDTPRLLPIEGQASRFEALFAPPDKGR